MYIEDGRIIGNNIINDNGILRGNGYIVVFKYTGKLSTFKIYYPDSRNPYPNWERDGNEFYYYTGKLGNTVEQGDHLIIESPNGFDLEYKHYGDDPNQPWRKFGDYNLNVDPGNQDFTKVAMLNETVGDVKTINYYRPLAVSDEDTTYEKYDTSMGPSSEPHIIQIRVPIDYLVNYHIGDTLYKAEKVKALQTLTAPQNPSEDIVIKGWYTDELLTNPYPRDKVVDSNLELYAKYDKYYELTHKVDGLVWSSSLRLENSKIPSVSTPTKVNSYFEGWYYDEEFTAKLELNDTISEDTVLYAKFMPLSGGEIPPINADQNETSIALISLGTTAVIITIGLLLINRKKIKKR